jgi:hypothetical protein
MEVAIINDIQRRETKITKETTKNSIFARINVFRLILEYSTIAVLLENSLETKSAVIIIEISGNTGIN